MALFFAPVVFLAVSSFFSCPSGISFLLSLQETLSVIPVISSCGFSFLPLLLCLAGSFLFALPVL
jgi:hypothetical protein